MHLASRIMSVFNPTFSRKRIRYLTQSIFWSKVQSLFTSVRHIPGSIRRTTPWWTLPCSSRVCPAMPSMRPSDTDGFGDVGFVLVFVWFVCWLNTFFDDLRLLFLISSDFSDGNQMRHVNKQPLSDQVELKKWAQEELKKSGVDVQVEGVSNLAETPRNICSQNRYRSTDLGSQVSAITMAPWWSKPPFDLLTFWSFDSFSSFNCYSVSGGKGDLVDEMTATCPNC